MTEEITTLIMKKLKQNADNLNRKTMTHSITTFDRKHLAPKKRVAPVTISFDMLYVFFQAVSFVVIAVLALDASCYMLWALSGQVPPDSFYAGALTAKLIALF